MPYLVVDNFSAGLDSRRHVLSSKDGTLAVLKNAHITRGGEIEKRKAFSVFANLPYSSGAHRSFGLETAGDKVYVFHYNVSWPSDLVPPPGITYQQLRHPQPGNPASSPSGYINMTKVVWSTVYGGKPFVIAEYEDGNRYPFWDGQIVKDWHIGLRRPDSVSTFFSSLAADLSLPGYTCTESSGVLTVTGPIGREYTLTASTTFGTATVTTTQQAVDAVTGKEATGTFAITGGSESASRITKRLTFINAAGLPDIVGIRVDGVSLVNGVGLQTIRWDDVPLPNVTDPGVRLANTLATRINEATSVTGYFATFSISPNPPGLDTGILTIHAARNLGPTADGRVLTIEFGADPAGVGGLSELATGVVNNPGPPPIWVGTSGTLANGATNTVSGVSVDGRQVMDQPVYWRESNTVTAQDVAAAINAYISTPKYSATAANGNVTITTQPGVGSLANGRQVIPSVTGSVTVAPVHSSPTSTSPIAKMEGGTDGVAGSGQVTTVSFSGVSGGDGYGPKVTLTIVDPEIADPYIFGGTRVSGLKPNFSITYKAKEYAAVGSTMYFSALNDARLWDIHDLGSGFIDMSNNFGGRESLTGFGIYQDKLAVFSRHNVQLWFLDADPAQNQQLQVLTNTGCIAPDSVVSMGAIDLLYLADNGIRSLRAREGTDTAFASDIGSAIDSIVISHLRTLTEEQKAAAKAIVDPVDGRYWLAIGDKIYVLSYFPGSNIAAWSIYEPGFVVDDFAVRGNQIFVRSGNTIYLYGGADGNTYDSCQVVVEFPYMDARKPATYKRAKAIDLTIEGQWRGEIGFDHTNPAAREVILRASDSTFAYGTVPVAGIGTHFGLRMVNQAPGYAKISNVIVHYDELQPKHEAG